jgi:glycosyltransferase involved in cell wall biosynthesis
VNRSIDIVVPACDEGATLATAVEALLAVDWGMPATVIVVDDGSVEPAQAALTAGGVATAAVRVVVQPRRSGRGAAIRRGAQDGHGALLAFHDGDHEYAADDLRRLTTFITRGDADVVIGSRHLGPGRSVMQYWRALGQRLVTWCSNAFTDLNLTDATSSCVVMTREVWQRLALTADGFDIDVEMIAAVARARVRVWEVPVSYAGRLRVDGRKSRRRDVARRLRRVVGSWWRGDRLLRRAEV